MSHEKGLLISFEGFGRLWKINPDSPHCRPLEEIDHRDVIVTREPGGTVIGEDIRHLLMHADSSESMLPETELLLFAASRAQLVRELFSPPLKKEKLFFVIAFSIPPRFIRE